MTLSIATPSGTTTVEADYVVACDSSGVPRRASASRLAGSAYSGWLVVDAKTSGSTASSRSLSLAIRAGPGSRLRGRRAGAVGVHATAACVGKAKRR